MSDSEPNTPSAATISRTLRDIVAAVYKAGNHDDLTLKRVRARAEEELRLSAGFLKSAEWNQKSKAIIVEAVDKCRPDEPAPSPKPTPAKKAQPKPKPAEKKAAKSKTENTKGVKRKATAPAQKPQKRQKPTTSDEESEAEISDAESEPPKKLARRVKNVVEEDSDNNDEDGTPKKATKGNKKVIESDESEGETARVKEPGTSLPETSGDKSDSEMSVLLDDSPPKNKRQKKEPAAKTKKEAKPTKATAKSTKSRGEDDPDTAEIKRLQGWLVKCGIRKVWSKELASCDTSKEKIKHLKAMLKDAGMDGKYSVEKAAKIKEKREFAKDLAAIQEGEAAWGKAGEETSGRPRRRAAAAAASRTVQKIVFEGDDEEDEEDGDGEEDDESSDDGDDDEDVEGESQDDEDQSDAGDDSE